MDRQLVYSGAIPLDTDLLSSELNAYIGLGKISAAVLGTGSLLSGFNCAPSSPASLNVVVAPGEMYSLQEIDTSAYSDIPANTTHSIVKQGVNLNSATLPITPPGTVGYSQNYLIEFLFTEQDTNSVVLAYYNPTNPSSPFSGPNNTGASNTTVRSDFVTITAKAGTAALTGTQTTPAPDAGYIGGWVVTVANGQSSITSGNISIAPGAPFITETLIQKISQATADARYAQQTQVQNSAFITGTDTSVSANSVVVNLSPALTSYVYGMEFNILIANSSTSSSSININGVGANTILNLDGSTITYGQLRAGAEQKFIFNGTNFILINPSVPTMISSVVLNSSFVSLSNNVAKDITQITVPIGTWDIWGNGFVTAASQLIISFYAWCSAVSATRPDNALCSLISGSSVTANIGSTGINTPFLRVTVATPTIYYLSCVCNSTGTINAGGGIHATPVRIS